MSLKLSTLKPEDFSTNTLSPEPVIFRPKQRPRPFTTIVRLKCQDPQLLALKPYSQV